MGSPNEWAEPPQTEKCRELVGEEASSKSGKFTFLNCFDMGSGSMACVVKEGVKLYTYSIRSRHVEKARHKAIETALVDAMSQGLEAKEAAKLAQKEGAKAAKLATRKAKRIIGPIISSGWDFFEALYYGGTVTEGFLRGAGTLFGTYAGGFLGEQRLGKVGYLIGSEMGSWVGGRIGLMVYDVVNGVHFLLFGPTGEIETAAVPSENPEASEGFQWYKLLSYGLQYVQTGEINTEKALSESSEPSQAPTWYDYFNLLLQFVQTVGEKTNKAPSETFKAPEVSKVDEVPSSSEAAEDSKVYEASQNFQPYETPEESNAYEASDYMNSEL
ncbi:hypothetical protein RJ641_023735 [Dillenia turbinata]|uniref:Uncharacterized protein n=1 Tax=Dillenia turbinata TaxID=194707 RepID=A0AAN8YT24_9MAGN